MNPILYTIIMVALWLVNLFNGTGLGQVYQTTEKARLVIYIVFIITVVIGCIGRQFLVDKTDYVIFGGMSFLFIFVSYFKGFGGMGLNYISVFLLIYVLSKIGVHDIAVKFTGIAYLVMGMAVLYIYDYGTLLSGWNGNTIGMIGLYSYLFFLISFYNVKNLRSKIIIIVVTLVYINLIGPTDSRSSILFAIVAALFAISILPRNFIIKTDKRYFFWLLVPLFIAIIVVIISHGAYMESLNEWSLKEFEKPIFNGRDGLWEQGIKVLGDNLFFGTGTFGGNWHNCFITVLTAYGSVGTLFWVLALQRILSKGREWINDTIVAGCIITFIMIFIQQSVELGLISEKPNLLPYIVLGVMLGRVKLLNEMDCLEK